MKHEASITVFPVKWLTRLTRLAGGFLFAAGLLLASSSGLAADNPQDDAAFTCSSAVNVMDCIKQTGTGAPAPTQPLDVTALPINSGLLGFTGPLTVGLRYDNYLAWILDVGYAQSFLDNNAAAALKLSAGLNERRANVSLGYAITPKQQIKLTYEYLAQNLPFDFASGKVNEWVNQNALGASYRYIIGHNILKNIEVYGTYTKAASRELAEREMYVDNLLTQINYRRIAGGTEITGGGNVTLAPLKGTILKVGAGYSSLSFDTKWQNNEATAALVYNAELTHLLTPTTLVSTGIGNTASGRTHTAKVSQILPWSLEASLIGQYVATTNDIPGAATISASLSYPAPKTYENMITAGLSSIKDWVEKPVVYHSRVLAKAEERVVQVQITTKPIPPANIEVGTTLNPSIQTKNCFAFNSEVYDKINYQITAITKKGDPSVTFPPDILNLQITPVDNFNAVLSSAIPIQTVAMTPGQYTVTLEAAGYRKGQVVSRINNPVDISVSGNPNLPAPSWKPGATVTPAVSGAPYPGTDLNKLVVDNSGLRDGDSYTFELSDYPTDWLTLGDDGHSMVSNGNSVPVTANNPTTVTINARSKVSGQPIEISPGNPGPKTFDIVINNTGTNPVWTGKNTLPNAIYQITYTENGENINLNTPAYISTGFQGGSEMQFTCIECAEPSGSIQRLPIVGLTLTTSGTNAGLIKGTPTEVNQIGMPITFKITAENLTTKLPSTTYQTFTIILNKNEGMKAPVWNSDKTEFTKANKDIPYETKLSDYFSNSVDNPGDTIDYTLNKGDCSSWLKDIEPSDPMLSGTPTAETKNCGITVTATSHASGKSLIVNDKPLIVLGKSPEWQTYTLPDVTYNSNSNLPINLDSPTYVKDSDPNDHFTFRLIAGSVLPRGLELNTNGSIEGKPYDMTEISTTPHPVTIEATSLNNTNLDPAERTLTIRVNPNKSLDFNAVWDPNKPLPNIAPNKIEYRYNLQDYIKITSPVGDTISKYELSINTCTSNDWAVPLSITNQSLGALSGTPDAKVAQSCTFTVKITSKATDNVVTLPVQNINISVGPTWLKQEFPNSPQYYDHGAFEAKINQDYVTSALPTGVQQVGVLGSYPSWITLTNPSQPNTPPYLTINANTDNDSLLDKPCSSITLNASDLNSTKQEFPLCILPNPKLIEPDYQGNLDQSTYGILYNLDIDPYTRPAGQDNEKYLSKTKTETEDHKPVADKLIFTITDNSACPWISFMPKTGTLTGTNTSTNLNPCTFEFTVKSTARGMTSGPIVANIAVNATAPDWNKMPTESPSIKLTTTDNNAPDAINLSNMVNKGTGLPETSFAIYFDSQFDSKGWKIDQNANNEYILTKDYVGNNQLDASAVGGSTVPVALVAHNAKGDSKATLYVKVINDENLYVKWQLPTDLITLHIGDSSGFIIDNNHIKSCVDPACTITIINDKVTQINGVTSSPAIPSGNTVNISNVGDGSYMFSISNLEKLTTSDVGDYDINFTGVITKASGKPTDEVTAKLKLETEAPIIINYPSGSTAGFWDETYSLWRLFKSLDLRTLNSKLINGAVYELEVQVAREPKDNMFGYICPAAVTSANVREYQNNICNIFEGTGTLILTFTNNVMTSKSILPYTHDTSKYLTFISANVSLGEKNLPGPDNYPVIVYLKFTRK